MQRTIFHLPGLTAAQSCRSRGERFYAERVVLNDNISCAWIAGVTPRRRPREVIEAPPPVLWRVHAEAEPNMSGTSGRESG
jgi:hypothetical protein